MLDAPLWVKIAFIVWVIAFIFIETAWDSIWGWLGRKFRSSARHPHAPQRLKRKPG